MIDWNSKKAGSDFGFFLVVSGCKDGAFRFLYGSTEFFSDFFWDSFFFLD